MNEVMKAIETYEDFELEYNKTLEELSKAYPRYSRVKKNENLTEDVFRIVINSVLLNVLKEMQIDGIKLTIKEFHRKYVPNLPILYRYDFSTEDYRTIIEHSYLSDRDKQIALKFFIEKKSQSGVHNDMANDCSKNTVDSSIEPINDIILDMACKFNAEYTKYKGN